MARQMCPEMEERRENGGMQLLFSLCQQEQEWLKGEQEQEGS